MSEVDGEVPMTEVAREAMEEKERLHLMPPQGCPRCKADLSDPGVDPRYRLYAGMFGRAGEIAVEKGRWAWVCPDCRLVFGKHKQKA